MLEYEFAIKERRRALEQAAAEHRLARQVTDTRRQNRLERAAGRNRWARLVAWMPRPAGRGAATPSFPYFRNEAG